MRISDWSSDVCSSDLHIARKIYPETRAIIEAHQAKGHRVAIISSATIYQIAPTARDLDIADIKCSAYAIEDGVFTGEIIRPLCFGDGKVLAAEELAADHGLDLDNSFFYSDSDEDIELLERVGKPRPLHPNPKLKADRKSVAKGQRESVRVDLGGSRNI